MAMVVVGGSGRGVGKTALVCGVIRTLPEFAWTAVKVTDHEHGLPEAIWEDRGQAAGPETDTARYLAAGARRAFLLAAEDEELPHLLEELWARLERDAHVIVESNRVLRYVRPDAFLAVRGDTDAAMKASLREVEGRVDAWVVSAERDGVAAGASPVFRLARMEQISAELREWLRAKLQQA